MKTIALLAALLFVSCTQGAVAPEASNVAPDATHSTTNSIAPSTPPAVSVPAPPPMLSLLVGNTITPAARGKWCLSEGVAPYVKVVIQDESIAAPIESQNAPLQKSVRQSPATGSVTSNHGDSQFAVQWLSSGQRGEGQMTVQNGDSLTWQVGTDSGTFKRCD